jgi:hypothetical protein
MSVALTVDAVIERRKTVTRRLGWRQLQYGDRLTLCRKVQGRKADEPLDRLAEVEVVSVRIERVDDITAEDVRAEGFDALTPAEFVEFFCRSMNCRPYDLVRRIEWRYLDGKDC